MPRHRSPLAGRNGRSAGPLATSIATAALVGIAAAAGACATGALPDAGPAAATASVRGEAIAPFQQGVRYTIEATLDEGTDVLHGRARLHYVNNAPFPLDTLYFQQYLNAFRPNSAWARYDLRTGVTTFQDLGPDEHGFERLTSVLVDGSPARPVHPGSPDSTVVAIPLPRPLRPGDSTTVVLDWEARLSTVPRRQGRRGRHFDFAQWYPRIGVVDAHGWQVNPLIRPGEFFGEFATWDVTLELTADQVVGATGVPVSGDPGYAAAAAPGYPPVSLRRDAYGQVRAEPLGFLEGEAPAGRRRVHFHARDAIHFAWSASPEYIYEGGEWKGAAVHVLYQPGDDDWADGVVLERTYRALDWTEEIFGTYPYPQLTNLHRIEPGGTEFPMVVMDGSPSEGLIVHEVLHQYAMAILASNEWREAWLDEGMASFATNWYFERRGQRGVWDRALASARELERTGRSEVVSQHSADFSTFQIYNAMVYTKASLVLRMLRELIGEDAFRRGLRLYYERNAFSHVTGEDLRRAMEEASGRGLEWFFHQWLHTTARLDYSIGSVRTAERWDGSWGTTVEVLRSGDAWMPVELEVGGVTTLLDSRERRQVVEVVTPSRPAEAVLDPRDVLLDVDPTNNRRRP